MSPMLALLYRQINVFRPNPNTYSVDFAVQKCTLTPHNTSCRFITSTNKSEHVWQNSQQNFQKCFPRGKQRWHLLRRIRFFFCVCEINHSVGFGFDLLNLPCIVIPDVNFCFQPIPVRWMFKWYIFSPYEDRRCFILINALVQFTKKTKTFLSILAFCPIQHSIVCSWPALWFMPWITLPIYPSTSTCRWWLQ